MERIMNMNDLHAMFDKAKNDKEFEAKLSALGESGAAADEVIAFAAEHGFTITEDELNPCGGDCTELSEDDLETVAGGEGSGLLKCYFTPKTNIPVLNGAWWLECASNCSILCACYRMNFCKDKWHLIDCRTHELKDYYYSNHKDKLRANGYNTK